MHRLFHDSLLFRPMMLPDKFHKLFLAHLLRGGAMQMTGLFIPVFLFLNATSYPLKQVIAPFNGSPLIAGLGTVCLFFLGVRVLTTLLALPAGKSMQKIGLIKSMFLGNVALVGVQLSLWFSLQNPWLIFVAMLCAALEALYYWTPYLTEFSAFADEKVLSNEVGFLEFSNRTVRAVLPMVGGVLIGLVGFDGLFATASALIVFSVVLLFFAPEVRLSGQPSFGEFRQWLKHPEYRKIAVGLAGRLWEDNGLALWPIYLFLFIGSAERVGYVYTLALLASLIITYFIGSAIHRAGERRSLIASATVLSIVWAVRSFAGQFWHFLTVDIAHRLIDSIYIPSFDVFLFRQSRHQKMFEFFIYRELLISIGSVVFWSLALSLFVLGIAWNGIFILAGLGVFASMWLSISKMRSDEYRIS